MSRQDDENAYRQGYPSQPASQGDYQQTTMYQTLPVGPPRHQQSRQARQRRQIKLACLGCLLALVSFFAIFVCILFVVGALVWNDYDQRLGEQLHKKEEEQTQAFQTAHIYDRRGNELHELFGEGRRTKIKLADV